MDILATYATSVGYRPAPKILLVEGTSDVALFNRAAKLEFERTAVHLLGQDLSIVAAGESDAGGTHGVLQQLTTLRSLAKLCLGQNGKPRYRIVALFDNDRAGRDAVRAAHDFDKSILEYKDVFRLRPIMPTPVNIDAPAIQRAFEQENQPHKELDWELEDLLPQSFQTAFTEEHPSAQLKMVTNNGFVHRDYTRDGKARFHRYVREHALREDMAGVCDVLRSMRRYLNMR
jgi:hypothetical protein